MIRSNLLHLAKSATGALRAPPCRPMMLSVQSFRLEANQERTRNGNLLFLDKKQVNASSTKVLPDDPEIPLSSLDWDIPFIQQDAEKARTRDWNHISQFLTRLSNKLSSNFELEITMTHCAMAPRRSPPPAHYLHYDLSIMGGQQDLSIVGAQHGSSMLLFEDQSLD
mmetsp:Transcript_9516/g.19012  ORF Transcript_9516/g.19012 Transcript_9516/m.19012 type:complete len:167 (+) Transcript_9516:312-812(+)|eukprot:CAMPEP_0181297574 /NCGR_PEP_ID=MMETSP1101-20121128/5312_1 /TAXON_ID=46948 /ORGANISM="Rhodomonas abbreviata, Strain Caron Lab Isolate" /LENGTH=166 /DNA_ID=CAMNT_0023402519 /DNA_START=307 /DNA_END=807 /DNA_ORIENTATION=+